MTAALGSGSGLNADLHSHSCMSDGLLSPADLVRRAHANGVELLALTDHDELEGLAEARAAAEELGLRFVDGVEISVSWGDDQTIHVVGLGVDPGYAVLDVGLAHLRSGRDDRARLMAAELDKVGIHGAYEGALRFVGNPALVGRSHFARYIVESGYAKDVKSVFDHWLARGKPGYVSHQWTTLQTAIDWIHGAGGVAVIAHPGRYRITKKALRRLLGEFRDLGGEAIEVLSGSHSDEEIAASARHAREFGLFASRGSDFHGPGESRIDLGRLPALPEDLRPVWQLLL
ncbi:conserved hypothetical protein [Sterolibacterium denitrificans]|uniref:Uncharacterized protein n=2 Tax=Sterolibacterium denitrificans TaxID=157592 RepID=A0A7Z7HSF8_9PROT|nr:3',5'-nucleoside bisphosphate phosphatase [Sterolibacterium denitrificans]KYC29204.1 phosphoesterase [Sterolibacterium denitrificans]SMB29606.1 conserved hypothetical protein [Sterolibacterium denitrificans]